MVELGGRLARAVAETLPKAEAARRGDAVLRHEVLSLQLPLRTVNIAEYARAAADFAALAAREPADDGVARVGLRTVRHPHAGTGEASGAGALRRQER